MLEGNGERPLRILFLAPFAPRLDAAHGGGQVLAQFLRELSARQRVALLYLRGADEPPIDDLFIRQCALVEEVRRPFSGSTTGQRLARYGRLLAALAQGRPMWAADWGSKAYFERAAALAQDWQPDLVQIEYQIMAQYLPALAGSPAPRILTDYEASLLAAPYLKSGPIALRRLAQRRDQEAWRRFEEAALRQVQSVVVFTERDRKILAELGQPAPIHTIPFGTNLERIADRRNEEYPMNLLFFGNFIHPPNIAAALRLAGDIFPRLKSQFPELTVTIVGDQPPAELKQAANDRILVTGWTPSLAPYLKRATVFVAPLDSGGGMRVKVAEALAAGLPVVATPLAVEGLDVKDGQQVFLADTDEEIAGRIAELLSSPARRAALSNQARCWAEVHLGWQKSIAAYEQLYRDLLGHSV